MLTVPAPELLASSMVAASGSNPFGQAQTNSKLNLAANLTHEWTMLLPSPTYTTCKDNFSVSACSSVRMRLPWCAYCKHVVEHAALETGPGQVWIHIHMCLLHIQSSYDWDSFSVVKGLRHKHKTKSTLVLSILPSSSHMVRASAMIYTQTSWHQFRQALTQWQSAKRICAAHCT